jgi:hypothetical protein
MTPMRFPHVTIPRGEFRPPPWADPGTDKEESAFMH